MVCCQRDELVAPPIEERVRGDDERTGLLSSHGSKRCVDLVFVAGPKDRHFLPERTGSRLCGFHLGVAVQIGRIHEISDGGSLRHELLQQLQSLSDGDVTKYGDTRDIAAWPAEACDKALPNGVAVGGEHDRNRLARRLS